jgi:hypothetical protein
MIKFNPFLSACSEDFAKVVFANSSNTFLFVDGKADAAMAPTLKAMLARGEAYVGECQRRKVKFLPKQVVRPIWAGKGLTDGPLIKSRGADLFLDFVKS